MNVRAKSLPIALLMLCAACGSPREEPIRIGVLSDCEGFAAPFYDVTLAGAALPLLHRGGSLAGHDPSSGVDDVSIGGHPVELSFGCAGDAIGDMVETRRLVEQEGVDILIGPNSIPNPIALVQYARRHPQTTFVIATGEPEGLGLGANVFRFTADSIQTAAGLGTYAFADLGWRTAKTVATPDFGEWGASAGFIAEFCSLGGTVTGRTWLDVVAEEVPSLLRTVPLDGADGWLVAADTGSSTTFLRRYARRDPPLADHVVSAAFFSTPILLDPSVVEKLGDALVGVVTASFVPLDDSQARWNAYVQDFDTAFPDLSVIAESAYHLTDIDYRNAMEAVLQALEATNGDLSDEGEAFQAALANVELDAPNGPIRLDDRRQAIVPIYVSRVEKGERGDLVYRTFRVIDGVDQTYSGAVELRSSEADRTQPACRRGNPPPWAVAT